MPLGRILDGMVYVVERYLPGLLRSDLLRGLSKLEQSQARADVGSAVRYLDSTVVLVDEACFCRFEGPSEAAVAEANRRAGLPFDRIVPAVTVESERRRSMSTSVTIPATVEIRRGRLAGLIGLVAALAAVITWALLTFAVNAGSATTQARTTVAVTNPAPVLAGREQSTPAPVEVRSVGYYLFGSSDSLTPAQLQIARDYMLGASGSLTPAERSIGYYLFETTDPPTSAQLQSIRSYLYGPSATR